MVADLYVSLDVPAEALKRVQILVLHVRRDPRLVG